MSLLSIFLIPTPFLNKKNKVNTKQTIETLKKSITGGSIELVNDFPIRCVPEAISWFKAIRKYI